MRAGEVSPVLGQNPFVCVVAAEKFIYSLAGVNHLCVLSYSRAAQRERDRRGVAEGLTHFFYNRGDALKVLLGSYHLNVEALAEYLGGAARKSGFVKARFLVADGVSRLSVACRQQVG